MNGTPSAHPSVSRAVPASGVLPSLTAQPQGVKCSTGRPNQLSHRQFWMDVSKTAAQHTCQAQLTRTRNLSCGAAGDEEIASTSGSSGRDLLVVGPGVLGGLAGKLWRDAYPAAVVVGQTNTDTNHGRLRRLGISPRLKQGAPQQKYPSVLFSAPPSGSSDYVGEVKDSLALWSGEGSFVFTSSSATFNTQGVDQITEATPSHPLGVSERIDRLLQSEQAVLDAGGCVVRLVGLYHANRGAHTFFLRQGEVPRWGGHVVNLIHYEDAAALCVKVLQGAGSASGKYSSRIFLGTDSHPLTFQEMMDATLASGAFQGSVTFTGPSEQSAAPGSSNADTRKALDWRPKYPSYTEFMAAGATDFYTSFEAAAPTAA